MMLIDFTKPTRTRDECFKLIEDYFSPTISFIRDDSLAIPSVSCNEDWKVLDNHEWQHLPDDVGHIQYFGLEIVDQRTIRYCSASGVHGLMHEAAHLTLAKRAWDMGKHGPDLYKFCDELPNNGHPYAQMEEMCVEFIGYQILDKLGLVFDALIHDMTTTDASGQLKPLSLTSMKSYFVEGTPDGIYMKGDIDFSPIYMYDEAKCSGDLFTVIRTHPLFRKYGHEFFRLCGIVDDDMNLIGMVNRDMVRANASKICGLFGMMRPPHDVEFIDFICM